MAGLCVAGAIAAGLVAVISSQRSERKAKRAVAAARPTVSRIVAAGDPFVVFRNTATGDDVTLGRISVAALDDGARPSRRLLAGPRCLRVAYSAGRGLCLDGAVGGGMSVKILDSQLRESSEVKLTGLPSRARIAPGGRWGGVTSFIVGHSYKDPGSFSTAATIIDLQRGKVIADLERDVDVTVDGKPMRARDRNFWGLTFAADGDTFYATAASGVRTWLIKGSIRERQAQAIHENVECPSLSPDGTRIAYKKSLAAGSGDWRFTVLDLRTGLETELTEPRSIDDQLEWVSDGMLAYADEDKTTWIIPADASGKPRRWLENADSLTAVGTASG